MNVNMKILLTIYWGNKYIAYLYTWLSDFTRNIFIRRLCDISLAQQSQKEEFPRKSYFALACVTENVCRVFMGF